MQRARMSAIALAMMVSAIILSLAASASAQLFRNRIIKQSSGQVQSVTPSQCPPGTVCPLPQQLQVLQTPTTPTPAPPIYSQPAYVAPQTPTQSIVSVPCRQLVLDLVPLDESSTIDLTDAPVMELADQVDRMEQVIRATVRVTVSGVCGSGTVVGRDSDGNSLVLTNAHVAGTAKGRQVNVQRWNADGTTEKGTGRIITAGYGRGLSVDFAVLVCPGFAIDVMPIPLADRYPDQKAGVTTYGCPRCEWPSMQVLSLTRAEGQVLRWLPEAIGGRSGSSLVDYTAAGPRVVGLLTWGGGGEGLGQSTPFLLDAMRGKLPKSFEALPDYAKELSASNPSPEPFPGPTIRVMPCDEETGQLLIATMSPQDETDGKTDDSLIDQIIEPKPKPKPEPKPDPKPEPDEPADEDDNGETRDGPLVRLFQFLRRSIITILLVVLAAAAAYFFARR